MQTWLQPQSPFTDCVPDEIYLPCWHSLRTTCKRRQPSQLALIQTWERRPNIRLDAWQFSNMSASNVVQAKQDKILKIELVRGNNVRRRGRDWDLVSVQGRVSCAPTPSSLTSLPTLSVSPRSLFAEKKKNVKWSRFCEHHLAARALIAPITHLSLSCQPTTLQQCS